MTWNNNMHKEYDKKSWVEYPSLFAEYAVWFFPQSGMILELGAWLGQDSRYFIQRWYRVLSTDYSQEALDLNKQRSKDEIGTWLYELQLLDISQDIAFSEGSFDIVYAHLSLHYFSLEATNKILEEIGRILRPGWRIAVLLNTIDDIEYGLWDWMEDDYYEIRWVKKRYFSVDSAKALFEKYFDTIVLDNQWETYKDRELWIHNLIRYIAKKI